MDSESILLNDMRQKNKDLKISLTFGIITKQTYKLNKTETESRKQVKLTVSRGEGVWRKGKKTEELRGPNFQL